MAPARAPQSCYPRTRDLHPRGDLLVASWATQLTPAGGWVGQGRPSLAASRNRRVATEVLGPRSPSGTAEPPLVSRGACPSPPPTLLCDCSHAKIGLLGGDGVRDSPGWSYKLSSKQGQWHACLGPPLHAVGPWEQTPTPSLPWAPSPAAPCQPPLLCGEGSVSRHRGVGRGPGPGSHEEPGDAAGASCWSGGPQEGSAASPMVSCPAGLVQAWAVGPSWAGWDHTSPRTGLGQGQEWSLNIGLPQVAGPEPLFCTRCRTPAGSRDKSQVCLGPPSLPWPHPCLSHGFRTLPASS